MFNPRPLNYTGSSSVELGGLRRRSRGRPFWDGAILKARELIIPARVQADSALALAQRAERRSDQPHNLIALEHVLVRRVILARPLPELVLGDPSLEMCDRVLIEVVVVGDLLHELVGNILTESLANLPVREHASCLVTNRGKRCRVQIKRVMRRLDEARVIARILDQLDAADRAFLLRWIAEEQDIVLVVGNSEPGDDLREQCQFAVVPSQFKSREKAIWLCTSTGSVSIALGS